MRHKEGENVMWCRNYRCPFKDCARHMVNIDKEGAFTVRDFDRTCERWLAWVEKEDGNE